MKAKQIVKILVDAAMFALFLPLMQRHLLPGTAHEWLGIALGVLFLLHNALNYRWYAALPKGRYDALRIAHTAVNFLLCLAMLGCLVSGALVSDSVFPMTGGQAYEFGRIVHLVATAWAFVLMALHLGLHWAQFAGLGRRAKLNESAKTVVRWVCRAAVLAVCAYGLYILIERNFWEELFYLIDYTKNYDYSKNSAVYLLETAAMAAMFAAIAYYCKKLLLFFRKRRTIKEKAVREQ